MRGGPGCTTTRWPRPASAGTGTRRARWWRWRPDRRGAAASVRRPGSRATASRTVGVEAVVEVAIAGRRHGQDRGRRRPSGELRGRNPGRCTKKGSSHRRIRRLSAIRRRFARLGHTLPSGVAYRRSDHATGVALRADPRMSTRIGEVVSRSHRAFPARTWPVRASHRSDEQARRASCDGRPHGADASPRVRTVQTTAAGLVVTTDGDARDRHVRAGNARCESAHDSPIGWTFRGSGPERYPGRMI